MRIDRQRARPPGVMAASTVGTWLRSLTFGHVRQLDRVTARSSAGRERPVPDPGTGRLPWMDSTICEVHGYHK
jgi:hypothetical protein